MSPVDHYFLKHEEPIRSCLQFLREHILKQNKSIREVWQYGMPFYYYGDKRFCYLWVHRKTGQPYLGIVEGSSVHHPDLIQEKRARMKILLIDPAKDIPLRKVNNIINQAIAQAHQ
ncbi:MAG: DUF1801 domain-containing protein [Cyclobacteriaceae bacterium]|nr:DUF1801 domain-containing protein [Cyclobacteriaceae bacterium]